jgi:hypothetical protein
VLLEGLGQLKKSSDLIGNRTDDLPACSIVPQPAALLRVPSGHTAAMLVYNLEKNASAKVAYLMKFYYRPPYRDHIFSGAVVASASHLRACSVSLLLILGGLKCTTLGRPPVV